MNDSIRNEHHGDHEHDIDTVDVDGRHLLKLVLLPGVGPRTLQNLLTAFGTPGEVLTANREALQRVPGVGDKLVHVLQTADDHVDVDDVLDWCSHHDVRLLFRGREDYPETLEELDDPPTVLFVRGNVRRSDAMSVGIVGTRHASPYGLRQARRIAMDLALAGITVVSGLARGIDTAAHQAAIEGHGRTLAFLGGGLHHLYPAENAGLADEITKCGAVISESPPMVKPRSSLFQQRNRLIAAMSAVTLVIEAPQRSGSLITACLAGELGRSVAALPGSVTSRGSRGCHELIRDGATLVQHAADVMELLGPMTHSVTIQDDDGNEAELHSGRELMLNEVERQILSGIGSEATSIDLLTASCELPPSRVAAVLSILEMKAFIRRLSGQYVSRI
ncbi:MAG: DNA-processing protein DprA [Planctomycetota bacterium]